MSTTDSLIAVWVLAVGIVLFFILAPLYEKIDTMRQARQKLEKRKALTDLVAMKELQEEIEIEMREALIRTELRGTNSKESAK